MPPILRRSRTDHLPAIAGCDARIARRAGLAAVIMCVCAAPTVRADSPEKSDDRVVRRRSASVTDLKNAPTRRSNVNLGVGTSQTAWLVPTFLVAGLGGIFLFIKRKQGGRSGIHRSNSLDVLSRTPLSAKQTLYMVRMGRRVVLLGATAEQVQTLAEVNDPVEVAEIVGAAAQSRGGSVTSQFTDFLKSAASPFREPEQTAKARPAPQEMNEARSGLDDLRRRVRGYAVNTTA